LARNLATPCLGPELKVRVATIKKGNWEWFKETIKIDEGNQKLRIHNKYSWNFLKTCIHQEKIQNLLNGEHLLKNLKHYLRMFKN
jgi:hypothetical protein